jgi:1-deoxy-D-xylulose-5-phosphate reductoisomerase
LPAHQRRFPGLQLAWDTLAGAQGSTAVLNAANEIAVAAFLERQIRFDQIHHVNLDALDKVHFGEPSTLEDVLVIDADARRCASARVRSMMAAH